MFERSKNTDIQEEDKQDVLAFLANKAIQNRQKIKQYNEENNCVEKAERKARLYKKKTKQK